MKRFALIIVACFMALCFAVPALASNQMADGGGLVFCDQATPPAVDAVAFQVATKGQTFHEASQLNQIIHTSFLAVVDSVESEAVNLACSLSGGHSGHLIILHSIDTDGSNLHSFIKA